MGHQFQTVLNYSSTIVCYTSPLYKYMNIIRLDTKTDTLKSKSPVNTGLSDENL